MRKCFFQAVTLVVILGLSQSDVTAGEGNEESMMSLGVLIYDAKCLPCHGKGGKGDGPAAGVLSPRPRDFTSGKFKFRTTETGSIPTDEDLLGTVRNGLHGTSMPDWAGFMSDDSLKAVLSYVKAFSPRFQSEKPKPVQLAKQVPPSPASIAGGMKVYGNLQCASCHGTDGNGTDAIASDLQDDWGHPLKPTNLTEPWTFRAGATAKDIYMRLKTGIDGSPMPSFSSATSDRELWDLANYVVSIARKPVWEMSGPEIKRFYAMQDSLARQGPVERGRQLVNTLGCVYCHTPVRDDGSVIEELYLAGGQRWNLYPFDDVVSYNLTSDKETGLGGWTDEQIKTFVTKGIRRNGTRMIPYPMPWAAYAGLKEDDLNALIAYLRTLPPVHNKIPDPKSPGILSYLWGKFQALILKRSLPLHSYPGNAGSTEGKPVSSNVIPSHQSREDRQ